MIAAPVTPGRDAGRAGRGGDGRDGDRLDEPDVALELVALGEEAGGERRAGVAMGLDEAAELGDERRAVLAVARRPSTSRVALTLRASSAATWRPSGS